MIPLATPNLTGKEQEYVADAIASGWVSGGGPYVDRFEAMVAEACGRKWAVAVLTGTAALHVALTANGVKGDRWTVAMPSMFFIAAANAVNYCGGKVRFREVEFSPDATALSIDGVGHVLDLAPAVGAIPSWAHAAFKTERNLLGCLSFNGNKNFTTGQGGAIIGDDPGDEARIRHLVSVAKCSANYDFDEVGFNYRMPNINAAMGCAQMERMGEFLAAKKQIMARYAEAGLDMVPSMWMAVAKFDDRDTVIAHLGDTGISARSFLKPLHLQEPYRDCLRPTLPNTEALWPKLVCLPCSTHLTRDDQDKVIKACETFLR